MAKPRLERVEALKRFLNDFPQSPQKEQATYQLALSYQNQNERVAALFEFLANFPETSLKEQAHLQVALAAADNEKKAASLREFVRQFPTSKLRAEAEYQLTLTVPAGGERQAAQESFVKAYPRSAGTNQLCQLLIDAFSRAKPVDEARLNAIIDIYVDGAGDTMTLGGYTLNQRAGRLNTVAELLATAEVMLDKALALIQQALTLAGEKEAPRTKTIYLTTLGRVFYRLKNYDQAERELTRAVQTGGTEGDGQAQLFLGKMYEARQEYGAALNAYCAASELASSEDLTSSLERVYQKTYGSLSGLQDRLDATYKARPKRFEAGHYSRTATLEPARVTLAELFTGAECGPCVVADLVFDGLAERYDRKTVAVLVYHLHVPGPDPMTNPDAIARATYYGVDGTPTAFMDGRSVHVAVGSSSLAAKLFSDFTGILEARIAVAPGATLTGFRAKVNGQRIVVKGAAVVEAGARGTATKATLHVALVQEIVRYTGSNGVRFHGFVVRKLLGPPTGLVLQPGTVTSFSDSVNIATLADTLDEYLVAYEKKLSSERSPFSFQDKATRLDAAKMLVVAFVQGDKTKEILQAVVVNPER